MKFRVHIKSGKNKWWEEFDVDTDDPQKWAQETIDNFNHTLRPGEAKRSISKQVRILDIDSIRDHLWRKDSLVTESGGYDRMSCSRCGITGKRYGLGQHGITRDKKYVGKKFKRCDDAMKALNIDPWIKGIEDACINYPQRL